MRCGMQENKDGKGEKKKNNECQNTLYIMYLLTQETSNKSGVAQRLLWVYVGEEKVLFQQRNSNIHFFLDNMALDPPIRIKQ